MQVWNFHRGYLPFLATSSTPNLPPSWSTLLTYPHTEPSSRPNVQEVEEVEEEEEEDFYFFLFFYFFLSFLSTCVKKKKQSKRWTTKKKCSTIRVSQKSHQRLKKMDDMPIELLECTVGHLNAFDIHRFGMTHRRAHLLLAYLNCNTLLL